MEITFNTKEESNKAQKTEFLKLSPKERFYTWLNLMYLNQKMMPQTPPENDNFLIVLSE